MRVPEDDVDEGRRGAEREVDEHVAPLPGEDAVIDDIGHGIGQLQVAAHINRSQLP